MTHPIMYAIAENHNEGFFRNFVTEEDDYNFPSFAHFLPSKQLTETYIDDYLSDRYEIVEVHLVSYKDNVIHVQYKDPKCWRHEDEDEDEEETA